jgi:hypothetical protein
MTQIMYAHVNKIIIIIKFPCQINSYITLNPTPFRTQRKFDKFIARK